MRSVRSATVFTLAGMALVLAACASGSTSTSASASPGQSEGQYLALGDSVAFGYTPPAVTPLATYSDAANFVGYPELVAKATGFHDSNASCSGEATGAFISLTSTDDNGCHSGYRLRYPLHVAYKTSQLDYAVTFLKTHHNTELVTINLGANDVFHLAVTCGGDQTCITNGLQGVLATNQQNLESIFGALRGAGYQGKIVALTYYSGDYNPGKTAGTIALNQPIIDAAKGYHVIIASGFDAFAPMANAHGGSSCAAGLLIALPAGGCDVHPTSLGHSLLSAAIVNAISDGTGSY